MTQSKRHKILLPTSLKLILWLVESRVFNLHESWSVRTVIFSFNGLLCRLCDVFSLPAALTFSRTCSFWLQTECEAWKSIFLLQLQSANTKEELNSATSKYHTSCHYLHCLTSKSETITVISTSDSDTALSFSQVLWLKVAAWCQLIRFSTVTLLIESNDFSMTLINSLTVLLLPWPINIVL